MRQNWLHKTVHRANNAFLTVLPCLLICVLNHISASAGWPRRWSHARHPSKSVSCIPACSLSPQCNRIFGTHSFNVAWMIRTGMFESVPCEFMPLTGLSPFSIWHLYLSYARLVNGLVKTFSISGSQGWNLTESIFVRLYHLFEVSKNPTRETLLGSKFFLVECRNVGTIDFKLNGERWDIGSSSLSSGSTTWKTESCCEGIGVHAGRSLFFVNINGRLNDIWRSLL